MNAYPIRHRKLVLLITFGILLVAMIPLSQIRINSDLESYMPDSMNAKQNNRAIEEYFSSNENLLIIVDAHSRSANEADILIPENLRPSQYETDILIPGNHRALPYETDILIPENLRALQYLCDELQQLQAVSRIYSVFQTNNIIHREGEMIIEPAIPNIPETIEEREYLRTSLRNNDLVTGLVISDDFRYALVMLDILRDTTHSDADAIMLEQVRAIIDNVGLKHPEFAGEIYVTGQPYLRYDANQKISRDILLLLPIGLLIMLLFLWISFGDIKSVLLPFTIVVFSIIGSMALLPALGWELSLIGVLIPIMMIAIANNYGIHVLARFQELTRMQSATQPTKNNQIILSQTIRYLRKPVWLCGLTTIAGTMGLTAHLLTPARQMGIVASLGIAFALTLSLTYLPAALSYIRISSTQSTKQFIPGLLPTLARQLTLHPGTPLTIALIFVIVCAAGIILLRVAPDSSGILPADHEFNKAIRIADEQFGGSKLLQIMIQGDAREPALLTAIDSVAQQLEQHPLVGHAASLATMIRKMHEESAVEQPNSLPDTRINDPQTNSLPDTHNYPLPNSLPDTREAIAQYLELYGMSADVADYERFIDFSYSHTLITVQYRSASLDEINTLIREIGTTLNNHQLKSKIGGISLVDKEISESVRTGQISSLAVALLAILVLLGIIFKSWKAGLIGSLPLVTAVVCTFGIMGWTGIELDIVTALLSSISIGLGVDFTIHIFWRMKHELQLNGGDWNSATINTITGTGRGISINAFSVMIGFSVLLLSAFPFIKAFGLLIILSLLLCLASALLVVPVICILIKPRFLLTKNESPS